MNKYIISVLIFTISAISTSDGLNFESMEDLGGAVILDRKPVHAFHLYRNNDVIYLVLHKEIGRDKRHPVWKVLDYIVIQNYGRDYVINFVMCELNGKFTPEIAAIAKYENKKYYNKIVKAWKADLESGKILKIDTKGIVCINEGYGA